MCGIVGQISCKPSPKQEWVEQATLLLRHRGPDSGDVWNSNNGKVSFGHRRLAIRDLSSNGSQPMLRGPLSITFNGEIYNFKELKQELTFCGAKFVTSSDTEVILAAYETWGIEGLKRLEGMFAFAIYDEKTNKVILARDKAGEKPLFYYRGEGFLCFSSELKGLLVNPNLSRKIDSFAFGLFLSLGFVPGGRCILKGYSKLPPGHFLTYDLRNGSMKVDQYWHPPALQTDPENNQLVDQLEFLMENAVKRQLSADVPVGVMLSGGLDSSLITAFASRTTNKIRTFNISFPGSGKFDEASHARLIADFFGTEHSEIPVEVPSPQLLVELAKQFDEPIIDSSMLPTYLVSKEIRRFCKVALGGDGADEIFGGYSHYKGLANLKPFCSLVPLLIRRLISSIAVRHMPLGQFGRNWVKALGTDLRQQVPIIANYFDGHSLEKLLVVKNITNSNTNSVLDVLTSNETDLLQKATRLDFLTYLPEDILVKVDRASMLNSLEVRAPFLDSQILDFAFSKVPIDQKVNSRNRKIILARLASRILPENFDYRRKQGFSIPIQQWLRDGQWRDFFMDVLFDTDQKLFSHTYISNLFEFQSKGKNCGEQLFGLLMFELWRKKYKIEGF